MLFALQEEQGHNEQKLLFIECHEFRQGRSHFLKKGGKINIRTLYVYKQSVFAFCVALRMNVDTTTEENFAFALCALSCVADIWKRRLRVTQ